MTFSPIASDEVLDLQEKKRMMWLFETRKERGVTISEMSDGRPYGMGIKQYNRCIKQLREDGNDIDCIYDGLYILHQYRQEYDEIHTGKFVGDLYTTDPIKVERPKFDIEEQKAKLDVLRAMWLDEKDSTKKSIIQRQGEAIKRAIALSE